MDEKIKSEEIETLNEKIIDAEKINADGLEGSDLEEVSGGAAAFCLLDVCGVDL